MKSYIIRADVRYTVEISIEAESEQSAIKEYKKIISTLTDFEHHNDSYDKLEFSLVELYDESIEADEC